MVALKHFFFVKSRSKAMLYWEIGSFEKIQNRVAEAALVIVLDVNYCFFSFDRKSGKGSQPSPSRGAYFTIFKVNCNTLASRRSDLSRINFALNSLIRSVRI